MKKQKRNLDFSLKSSEWFDIFMDVYHDEKTSLKAAKDAQKAFGHFKKQELSETDSNENNINLNDEII